jgi:hypothetical protein
MKTIKKIWIFFFILNTHRAMQAKRAALYRAGIVQKC